MAEHSSELCSELGEFLESPSPEVRTQRPMGWTLPTELYVLPLTVSATNAAQQTAQTTVYALLRPN